MRLPLPLPAEACRPRDVTCFSLLRTSLPGPAPRGPAQPGLIGPAVRCALLRVSGAAGPRYRAPALLRGTAPSSPPPSPTQSTGFQPSHGTLRVPAASPPAATAAAASPHSGPHLFEDLCALVTPDSLNAIAGDQRVANASDVCDLPRVSSTVLDPSASLRLAASRHWRREALADLFCFSAHLFCSLHQYGRQFKLQSFDSVYGRTT